MNARTCWLEGSRLAVATLVLGLLGCSGEMGDGGEIGPGPAMMATGGAGGTGSGKGGAAGMTTTPMLPSPVGACGAATTRRPGPAPLRRLSRVEYDETVRDLLGDTSRPGLAFADGIGTTTLLAEQHEAAADRLATTAAKDLPKLLGCDPAAAACLKGFVARFGKRAFRRPLVPAELTRYEAFLNAQRTAYDVTSGVKQLVKAMLLSPHFLYRVEMGGALQGGALRLTSHEVASRLSYLFIGSMPDDALFAAADANQLDTPERVAAQAKRLLELPRARGLVAQFFRQWLEIERLDEIEKDLKVFPTWNETLGPLLSKEVETFVLDLVFAKGAPFTDLYTAHHTFLDQRLAGHYGLRGPTDAKFVEVKLEPGRSAGVLTLGGVMASHANPNQTSPIARGRFVREQLLCQALLPPPADLEINAPDPDPKLTTRERFAEHSRNPSCAGCHRLIDPVGFGFEAFDGIGLPRTTENGKPIDTSGELIGTKEVDGPYNGVPGLAAKLAASEEASNCFATQWFRHAYGRAETAEDQCSHAQLQAVVRKPGASMRDLLIALTQTDAFLYRSPTTAGEAP